MLLGQLQTDLPFQHGELHRDSRRRLLQRFRHCRDRAKLVSVAVAALPFGERLTIVKVIAVQVVGLVLGAAG